MRLNPIGCLPLADQRFENRIGDGISPRSILLEESLGTRLHRDDLDPRDAPSLMG